MTIENYLAINRALCYMAAQVDVIKLSGDFETAKKVQKDWLKAKAALEEEKRK